MHPTRTPTANDPLAQAASAAFRAELREFARGSSARRHGPVPLRGAARTAQAAQRQGRPRPAARGGPRRTGDHHGLSSRRAPRGRCRLAGIWADVLGAGQVALRDDFFELGGDSLAAAQMAARLRAAPAPGSACASCSTTRPWSDLAGHLAADAGAEAAAHGAGHPRSCQRGPRGEAALPADVSPRPGHCHRRGRPYRCPADRRHRLHRRVPDAGAAGPVRRRACTSWSAPTAPAGRGPGAAAMEGTACGGTATSSASPECPATWAGRTSGWTGRPTCGWPGTSR